VPLSKGLETRLREMDERFSEIDELIQDPAILSDPARSTTLLKERGHLDKLVAPFRELVRLRDEAEQARSLLEEDDPELRELAEAEIPELTQRREKLLRGLQERLVTGDEALIRSVLVEIRAGTGGDEAALFARDLLTMYTAFAQRKGFKIETLSLSESELGGIKEAILNITGEEVYLPFRFEAGGHRVQRVPKTEAQGRIHTSAATVAVMPEPEEIEVDIDWEKDVLEHVSRAGGPGGQNVNKVSSAIRLEHVPTGITVSMRDEKSQHKNRAKARQILKSRIYEHFQQLSSRS
jgi:peptide chain release factor 1